MFSGSGKRVLIPHYRSFLRQCLSRPWFWVWLVDSTYIHTRDVFDHLTVMGLRQSWNMHEGHSSAIDHAITFYDPNKRPSSLGIPSDPVNINKIKCFSRGFGCEKQASLVLFVITPSHFTTPINGRPHLVYHPIQWILTKLNVFLADFVVRNKQALFFSWSFTSNPTISLSLSPKQKRWMMS